MIAENKTILTADQQKTLDLFQEEKELSELFYLSGGTALAEFYLKHRLSDDLDFFTSEKDFPLTMVEEFIKKLGRELNREARFQKLHDRHMFFLSDQADTTSQELKIEFTRYPFPQLAEHKTVGRLKIDSLLDIAANKLMAMIERFEPKDFVDLYFLLNKHFEISEVVAAVDKKFGFKIEPITLGSELTKAKRITFLPNMKLELSLGELVSFFLKLAEGLRPQVLE